MEGNIKVRKPLFPDYDIEWWKTINSNNDDAMNYGSIVSSHEPVLDNADDCGDEGEPSSSLGFPECLIFDSSASEMKRPCLQSQDYAEFGSSVDNQHQQQQLDSPSDISCDDDDYSSTSSGDNSSEYEYEDDYDEIEKPHRTLGLIVFDFLRFVVISSNIRCINTQIVPVFIAWGTMDILHVALRVFMATFSLLLVLVEFPGRFLFLQHATSPVQPLYIINWIPRGIFYIFLAIICFEQSIVVRALDEARKASTSSRFFDAFFIDLSGWIMLLVGVAYILLGIFCIQKVMERVRKDEKEKWNEYYAKLQITETEREEAEEREWLLENGKLDKEQLQRGHEHNTADDGRGRCWQKTQRWRRKCKRRRMRGQGGTCYQLGFRTIDFRC